MLAELIVSFLLLGDGQGSIKLEILFNFRTVWALVFGSIHVDSWDEV